MDPSRRQLNKRCRCGSGKKFKNCCGQEHILPKQIRVPYYPPQDDPYLKPPGYTHLTYAFLYEGEYEPRTNLMGELGEYEVTFTLLQPGQAAEVVKESGTTRIFEVQNEKIVGDSHLAICMPQDARPASNADIRPVVKVKVNRYGSGEMEITLMPNDSGRLSKLHVDLDAESFDDAQKRAYHEASTLLSDLAFKLDIPLRIAHTHIKEVETKHVRIGFVRQFGYRGLANLSEYEQPSGGFGMEMGNHTYQALLSVYRDGLNSESPFYQFLCFCRIIQRLKDVLRPRWEKIIAGHDKKLLPTYRKHERISESGEEPDIGPESLRGKKFYKVYDDKLRPLRNGIGHVFLEDMDDEASPERSTDEYEFLNEVYIYLPVAHHIARTMLENDFGLRGSGRLAADLQANN